MKSKIKLLLRATLLYMLFSFVLYEAKADWQTYNYSEGKFKMNFPANPATETDGDYKTLTASDGKQVYRVTFITRDATFENPQEHIDAAFTSYGNVNGSVKKLNNGNLKGQEAKVKSGTNNFLIRVWMSEYRIWILITAKQLGKIDEKKANVFFDSFVANIENTNVATTQSNSSSNASSSSSSSNNDGSFDAMAYFKSKTFPHISNINDIMGWKGYSMLQMFVNNDLSDIKEKIDTYGEANISTSYAGKKGIQFMNQDLPKIYPLFPQIINQYLEGVSITPAKDGEDFVQGKPRLLYLKKVADLASDFETVNPNAETKAAHKKAIETYNKAISAAPYIKGNYHKNNLGQVALFKDEIPVGEGSKEKTSKILSPKNGKFLVGYFPNPLNSGQRYVGMKWRKKDGFTYSQKLFVWKKDEETFLKNNGAIGFNVFPNPESLDYKSGYQYDVHLNILKFLLNLPNGSHELEIGFTRDKMANTNTEIGYNTFVFEMNEASRSEIQSLFDKLLQRRIEATMPQACRDDRKMISNLEGFGKYGKLLKFVHTDTPSEVKDAKWPHPVIGYATSGWAAIERPNGTVEIIPIGLFKKVNGTVWNFTAIDQIPSLFEMSGDKTLFSGRGEFGYLMKKENISKCHEWE
ncbi:hypothetical protein [Bernardetia sp.]|uniref:hypothetical protein n=1 Tax=Bernardetia sp. TaxID=1937974 RepID=UPI0025C6EE95|nr:hypothetical protein [Bernardetia sp.]